MNGKMTEYTSLDVSKRLAEAGFKGQSDYAWWNLGSTQIGGRISHHNADFGPRDTRLICHAHNVGTLLSWLLSHGDSIEITPDLDGFNCTFWAKHEDYNGINIFLCDVLAEVVLQVLAKEAKHD